MTLPHDIQEFLANYPDVTKDTDLSDNYRFYSNQLPCQPDNLSIDQFHGRFGGDYANLESRHGYIQWLFPIQEEGVNMLAQALQPHEISSMKTDEQIQKRLITSYKIMLHFYGMSLARQDTGLLSRSPDYSSRYAHLQRSMHNNLRITRILKCLSELGLEHLNAGFLLHVLNEQSENSKLDSRNIKGSMDRWWANCIRDSYEREWIGRMISKVRSNGEFVFTREMYETALTARKSYGRFE
ncbi:opioid growth factor receptor conserved domain-containing protein [Hygrophoropsis aurantiaca]|uniref:Opioid growth factor receptor conserved domain-containing protein n=1 Tax=Hygrophoropsis aurantiaca TaxID=72124 RepID=A0ACB8AGG6_9AGAM|nr:opioid growth factor receptor conserved domain-containing protein [Hygrophoropsis aurantiaca]